MLIPNISYYLLVTNEMTDLVTFLDMRVLNVIWEIFDSHKFLQI